MMLTQFGTNCCRLPGREAEAGRRLGEGERLPYRRRERDSVGPGRGQGVRVPRGGDYRRRRRRLQPQHGTRQSLREERSDHNAT